MNILSGSSSVGRVSAFQADCREFESRLPLIKKDLGFQILFICEVRIKERATHMFCTCVCELTWENRKGNTNSQKNIRSMRKDFC